jgi:hypothetical protein
MLEKCLSIKAKQAMLHSSWIVVRAETSGGGGSESQHSFTVHEANSF